MYALNWRSVVFAALILATSSEAPAQRELKVGDVVAGNHSPDTVFRLITARGSVAFAVPDQWPVLAMQSEPPVSVAAFQVPNPADEGTSDSTNVAITLFHLDTEAARSAELKVGRAYGTDAAVTSKYSNWTIYTQQPYQGATKYTLVDAIRELPDLHLAVAVRLAWPHLRRSPDGYDSRMFEL